MWIDCADPSCPYCVGGVGRCSFHWVTLDGMNCLVDCPGCLHGDRCGQAQCVQCNGSVPKGPVVASKLNWNSFLWNSQTFTFTTTTTASDPYGLLQVRPSLPVEHIAKPVVGYRCWRVAYAENSVTGDRGSLLPGLYSQFGRLEWLPGINVADCRPGLSYPYPAPHRVPDLHCSCGFYARHTVDDVDLGEQDDTPVMGVVEGAGRIIWCEGGWRAEKARIVAAYSDDPTIRVMVENVFDVPVYDDVQDLERYWPPTKLG